MKILRKVSAIALSASVMAGMLAGCSEKVDTEQQALDAAAGAIVLTGYTQVTSNILAPKYISKEGQKYEIEYTSDYKDLEVAPWDDSRVKLIFERPESGKDAVPYTITGTVKLGDKKSSKEMKGYVMPMPKGLHVVANLEEAIAAYKEAKKDIDILYTGIVDCVINGGYYVRDLNTANHMYVYKDPKMDDIKIGDKVKFMGGPLTKYYSQYEIKGGVSVDILARDQDVSREATKITAEELYKLNDKDYTILGKLYNVNLRVKAGKYINFEDPDNPKNSFQGYNLTPAAAEVVKPYDGKVVNIDVVFYTSNKHRLTFNPKDHIEEVK